MADAASSPGRSSSPPSRTGRRSSSNGATRQSHRPLSRRPRQRMPRAWCAELGAAGFLKLCVADGRHRPDVRSLAICPRDPRPLSRPRRFRLRHAGPRLGRDLAVRHDRAEARMAAQGRGRDGHRRLRHDRAANAGPTPPTCPTSAMRDGNEWVLVGEKTYISNGGIADFYVTFARTGEGEGSRGLSAFIVPADAVDRRRADRGHRAAPARAAELRQCPRARPTRSSASRARASASAWRR